MRKKILITGGAGFVGSHLCGSLLQLGHEVVSLDNFHTGRAENLAPLMDDPRFRSVEGDVADPFGFDVDEIYNLASPASPVSYQESPIRTLRTGLLGAMNALDLAVRTGARVLQASTSEVYGDPLVHPQVETYFGNANSFGERACYDEGKRAAEALFFAYRAERGVDIRIARIFNTYGPGMQPDDGRVVSNFIVQALQNRPITVYGDGSQTRSFCYVSDLVDGLIGLMESDVDLPVNLGNPGEFSVLELARTVIAMTGSRSGIEHLPLPADDPRVRRPDISRARARLGWEPRVALGEGLRPTIGYFERRLRLAGSLPFVPARAGVPLEAAE